MIGLFVLPLTLLVILLIGVPLALYYAWAASYLWAWFIVPALGAPPLTVLQMWGVMIFLGLLRPRLSLDKKNTEGWEAGLFAIVFTPPLALAIGYAVRFWWMPA